MSPVWVRWLCLCTCPLCITSLAKASIALKASVDVWPLPSSVSSGTESSSISAALQFQGDVQNSLVQAAIDNYRPLIFPHKLDCPCEGEIKGARLVVNGDVGEGYKLYVNASGVHIEADSPAGVQYALESLSQLVFFDFDKLLYVTQSVLPLIIEDRPRFPHRGLLIDSSRHFLPVETIKHLINSMSYTKLNVLHWHITDSESFPIMSRVAPELAKKGAHSGRERYTRADVADIVDHARKRSIVVIPEFDMPGHADSWAKSHPELFAAVSESAFRGVHGALNPSKEEVFAMVENLLVDWLKGNSSAPAFFDGDIVHLGGDEVPTKAWATPAIQEFMRKSGIHNMKDLFASFLSRNVDIAKKLGKRVILWDEAFEESTRGKLPTSVTFQIWRDWGRLRLGRDAVLAGYKIIASPNSRWYLDHLDTSWQDMYATDPVKYLHVPKEHASNVIGGEGCMWGETVDPGDLEATVWPRLAAIAERLWSPETATSADAALPRLEAFRCLLLERGIDAARVGAHLGDKDRRYAPQAPGSCNGDAAVSFLQIASKRSTGFWQHIERSLSTVISGSGGVESAPVKCSCAKL
mmetsp:Transcript_48502/g.76632  ORF Transcript_48502/g.76632 Transcript_48502/m.76632 type:complete len:581 (+) Transcript_48502:59-1801(+)